MSTSDCLDHGAKEMDNVMMDDNGSGRANKSLGEDGC